MTGVTFGEPQGYESRFQIGDRVEMVQRIKKSERFKVGDRVKTSKVFHPFYGQIGVVDKIDYEKSVVYGQFEVMQIVTVRLDDGSSYREHERYLFLAEREK